MGHRKEEEMKDEKIKNVRCHLGITQFGGQNTLELGKMKECSMEMNAVGVVVQAKQGEHAKRVFIPFTNITHVELEPVEHKAKK